MYQNKADRDSSLWLFAFVMITAGAGTVAEVFIGIWPFVAILGAVAVAGLGGWLKAKFFIAITIENQRSQDNARRIGPFRIWRQKFDERSR